MKDCRPTTACHCGLGPMFWLNHATRAFSSASSHSCTSTTSGASARRTRENGPGDFMGLPRRTFQETPLTALAGRSGRATSGSAASASGAGRPSAPNCQINSRPLSPQQARLSEWLNGGAAACPQG